MNTDSTAQRIEASWAQRVKNLGLKPGTRKYFTAQAEFFSGAMCALQAALTTPDDPKLHESIPPKWVIALMSDRDILKF